MMIRSLFILLLTLRSLQAYTDTDLDGVEDQNDRCPGTLFTELVDASGCPVTSLKSEHHYSFIFGLSYSERDEKFYIQNQTLTTSVQLDYYYKRLNVQAYLSRYATDDTSGMNDISLSLYYRFNPTHALTVRAGAGVIFPTFETGYDNEAIDYSFNAQLYYNMGSSTLFGTLSHTLINDQDTATFSYQNSTACSLGYGHTFDSKLYTSLSYYQTQSIYTGLDPIKSGSIYLYFPFDEHYFVTAGYSMGLSDSASDHHASLRFGFFY